MAVISRIKHDSIVVLLRQKLNTKNKQKKTEGHSFAELISLESF